MEKLADRFVLERRVGSGGMSTVYLGRDEVLGRPVAVKVLKHGFAGTDIGDRFQREGKTAARLAHPSIVPVYDAGEAELDGREVSYIVMEHVPGGDLKDLLDRRGPLGDQELSRIGREVAEGLAHAHERGVVHRDIKPHNILLDDSGRPKLTDFGIARALESTRMTQTGSYLGTASYSSPEQLRGREVTPKSDVYSLGATLYQAATGSPPFQGPPMEVAEKHLSEEPLPPKALAPDLGDELSSLILACLAKDPEERPSAKEIAARLTDISEGRSEGVAAAAPPPAARHREPPPRPARRRRRRGILASLAVLAVLVLLGLMAIPALLGDGTGEDVADQQAPEQQEAPEQGGGATPAGDQSGEEATPEQTPEQPEAPPAEPVSEEPASEEPASEEPASEEPASEEPEEQPAEPAPEEPEDPLSEEAAAEAVEGFYTTAADGEYGRTSTFLSDGIRQRLYPDEATLEGTFATLESIRFVEGPQVEVSGETATVTGTTEAVHTDRVERNSGTWTLVQEDGEWKIDDLSVQPVDA